MNKRKEFEHLLYGTTIESICSKEKANNKLKILQEWIIANIPNRLYRFRANTDYTIDALRKDQIWGSNLWQLNDPYECVPYYNSDTLQRTLEKELSFENIYKFINLLKCGIISDGLNQTVDSDIIEKMRDIIPDTIDEGELRKNCAIRKQQIIDFILNNFRSITNQFFTGILHAESQRHISCFSEKNNSSLMWGHYANGHHGFCLEYDFKSILKPCNKGCSDIKGCNNFMLTPSIAPVIYSETRFDATSHLFTVIQASIISEIEAPIELYYGDTLLISKCLLTKSADWEYEKEWRLFSPPSVETIPAHKVIFSMKPTALYIGARASTQQDQLLSDICKEKNIPCYKMIQNYHGDDFSLFSAPYEDYRKSIS